jgi:hypothetical protein
MTRVLIVLAALVLGLVGLLMSVCGGGVMLITISSPGGELGSILAIAVPSLLFGILFVWLSVVILRKKLAGRDRDS